jgi:hypothetical protein
MNTVEEEPKSEAGAVNAHQQAARLETDAKPDRKKAMTNEELLELAKLNLQAFEDRRKMEWQLLLGYWTGLGLVTYIFGSGTVSISGVLLWVMVAALVAMLTVLITCCIVPIQQAHAIDHKFFVHYIRRIEGTAAEEDRPHPRKIRMYRPWLIGQSLFSALLTIIAIVMIMAGWINEIKAAIKNLKQNLKRLPNNKTKREPIEQAIKRGEDFLKECGQSAE